MTETCRIIESKSRSIITEIDAKNNSKLLHDISKKYFIKRISQRRIEKKNWSRLHFGESIHYVKNWFLLKKIMPFSIERVRRLEHMTAEMIFYYILNLSCIFQ